jgi:hypothetical protein
MKSLLLAAVIGAATTAVQAAPWQSGLLDDEITTYYFAYQQAENGEHRLGYECEASSGVDVFVIETPEPYDPTTSYAPEVPTSFIIDGETIEVSGVFQDRQGKLFVAYESFAIDGFGALFDKLLVAQSPVRVTFFDRDLSFSSEGLREAVQPIYDECVY